MSDFTSLVDSTVVEAVLLSVFSDVTNYSEVVSVSEFPGNLIINGPNHYVDNVFESSTSYGMFLDKYFILFSRAEDNMGVRGISPTVVVDLEDRTDISQYFSLEYNFVFKLSHYNVYNRQTGNYDLVRANVEYKAINVLDAS